MKENIHPVDITVGANIRKARILRQMSQEQLAAGLGITFQQVQKYEKGSNRVSASRLYEISKIFHLDIASFFAGTEDIEIVELQNSELSAPALRVALDFQKIRSERSRKAVHNVIKAVIGSPDDEEQAAA